MRLSFVLALASAAILCLTSTLAGAAPVVTSKTQNCRRVSVSFEPDGGGGAINIRATNVGCRKARRVVRHCIKGTVDDGWTATPKDNYAKIQLTSGVRKIVYTAVGGGGCVPSP